MSLIVQYPFAHLGSVGESRERRGGLDSISRVDTLPPY